MTSRLSSPSPLAVGTPPEAVTGTPHEKCRLRSAKPAFGQLNQPIERTSEPRSHHQSPMSTRMSCGPSTMPQNPQLAPTSARQGRRLELRDPPGTPKWSGAALGPLGGSPRAPEGPAEPPRLDSRTAGNRWRRVKGLIRCIRGTAYSLLHIAPAFRIYVTHAF